MHLLFQIMGQGRINFSLPPSPPAGGEKEGPSHLLDHSDQSDYTKAMKVYGLTGGIGMGKSAATELLKGRGVPVVDTDVLAHQLVEPGQPALAEIREAFGNEVIDVAGRLNRSLLASRVFGHEEERRRLEAILHPRIRQAWQTRIQQWNKAGMERAMVVIPLLFETGAEKEVDETICVACSAPTQRHRLEARGWTTEQIKQRIQAQWPITKKMDQADYLIWNEGSMEILEAQLVRVVT